MYIPLLTLATFTGHWYRSQSDWQKSRGLMISSSLDSTFSTSSNLAIVDYISLSIVEELRYYFLVASSITQTAIIVLLDFQTRMTVSTSFLRVKYGRWHGKQEADFPLSNLWHFELLEHILLQTNWSNSTLQWHAVPRCRSSLYWDSFWQIVSFQTSTFAACGLYCQTGSRKRNLAPILEYSAMFTRDWQRVKGGWYCSNFRRL